MKKFSNMKWEELLNELYSVINVLSKIENLEKQKNSKQSESSSLYAKISEIEKCDVKVGGCLTGIVHYFITYGLSTFVVFMVADMEVISKNHLIYFGVIVYLLGFSLSQFLLRLWKRSLINSKKEKEKDLPNIRNRIEAVNNEINSLQREIDKVYKENNSLLRSVPSTYLNKAALIAMYNILYNQRAYDWKNAVNIYESDLNQQKLLNQQKQFQEEQLKKAEEILKEQQRIREDNARYQESQLQLGREQADRAAAVESAINRLH